MLRTPWTLAAVAALAAGLAGCAAPRVTPPPVVATLPPPPPPPPTMPRGGYAGMEIAAKRDDGSYVTPNFQMTDAAAVWHLRGALNVAALACDGAGGGVTDPYNAWIVAHRTGLDGYVKRYQHEWEETGWADWQAAYDNQQTRLYNFYSQPAIRVAFCAVARQEIAAVAPVADADLPLHARGALARLDKPFIDFFTAFDKWRDYYEPKVTPPPVVPTLPAAAPTPVETVAIPPSSGAAAVSDVAAPADAGTPAPTVNPAAEAASTSPAPPEVEATPVPSATRPAAPGQPSS
ncbi:hypothetical protein D9601_15300 [Sphingomonas sp. MA1305]|uniref:hypothetical protein n=1 Tax=Sphingomonas sp. MA1305 TaxID=2479204 RepID=UPI0018DF7608|nr:hypothetical protein [Sphingomonas sp. MA1305]MBI0476715.1 hypothetical protein [Sphingomonas sp. MA1305]